MTGPSRRLAVESARHRRADRTWVGVGVALAGAVLLFLGWWGASGAATVAEQLPYFASGSIPGAALVVAGAVLLSRESAQNTARRTDELLDELRALLVEDVPDAPAAPTTAGAAPALAPSASQGKVAVEGGHRYHRADCLLVVGKAGLESVDAPTITERQLSPCDVCEPDRPAV
jgi:hypothetical protein